MVISIARQSVILKCLRQKSVLLGNYEFYYLAGLMTKCFGIELSAEMKPQELSEHILEKLDSLTPSNDNEQYLLKLVAVYEPLEAYDDQMKELFDWGATEEDLWQVNTKVDR